MNKSSKNYDDKKMLEYLGEYYSQYYHSMSNVEENKLIDEMNKGNEEAYTHLFISNISTVLNCAKRYDGINPYLSIEDLIQIGCRSLTVAIKRYDPQYNIRVSTYSYPQIESGIRNSVYKNNQIVGRNTTLVNERQFVKNLYDNSNGYLMSLDDFFIYTNEMLKQKNRRLLSKEDFIEVMDSINYEVISIGNDDKTINIEEMYIDDNSEERIIDNILYKKYINQILTIYINESRKTEALIRNLEIIKLHYRLYDNNPVTDNILASHFNISLQAVSYIRKNFVEKINEVLAGGLQIYNDLELAINYYFEKNDIPLAMAEECEINQKYIDDIEYIEIKKQCNFKGKKKILTNKKNTIKK